MAIDPRYNLEPITAPLQERAIAWSKEISNRFGIASSNSLYLPGTLSIPESTALVFSRQPGDKTHGPSTAVELGGSRVLPNHGSPGERCRPGRDEWPDPGMEEKAPSKRNCL